MFKYYLSIGVLTVFVIVLIIYGIIQSGGPVSAKSIKLDEERLNNFSSISYEINEYFYENQKLPENLTVLSSSSSTGRKLKLTDPETKKPYEYKKSSPLDYNLCTTFSTDSSEVSERFEGYEYYDEYGYGSEKKHPKGYHCVNYKVDDYYVEDEYLDVYDYPEEDYENVDPTTSPAPISIKMISPNFKWHSDTYAADITISKAYLTNSAINNIKEDEGEKKLFIVFNLANRGNTNAIYSKQLATLIAERDRDGVLTYPMRYEGFKGSPVTATEMYGVFLPPSFITSNFYELSVGDEGEEQTVNLDFTNATEVSGTFDTNNGFIAE